MYDACRVKVMAMPRVLQGRHASIAQVVQKKCKESQTFNGLHFCFVSTQCLVEEKATPSTGAPACEASHLKFQRSDSR